MTNPTLDAKARLLKRLIARRVADIAIIRDVQWVELARRLGISASALRAMLRQEDRSIKLDSIVRLADALDCDVELRIMPRKREQDAGVEEAFGQTEEGGWE